ncbi:hypothetical protein PAHAL_1G066400 [Panicum hallii]|uniref:Uncharacterized protein n=1 Tax=Panicum hallii TaxID=206008 RepID=A0A2T8KU95_9POAL|nr:hypothetical protein PAHAL_1G066400 [Panicum hallii]
MLQYSMGAVLPCLATTVHDAQKVFEEMIASNPVKLYPSPNTFVDKGPWQSILNVEHVGILPKPPWSLFCLENDNYKAWSSGQHQFNKFSLQHPLEGILVIDSLHQFNKSLVSQHGLEELLLHCVHCSFMKLMASLTVKNLCWRSDTMTTCLWRAGLTCYSDSIVKFASSRYLQINGLDHRNDVDKFQLDVKIPVTCHSYYLELLTVVEIKFNSQPSVTHCQTEEQQLDYKAYKLSEVKWSSAARIRKPSKLSHLVGYTRKAPLVLFTSSVSFTWRNFGHFAWWCSNVQNKNKWLSTEADWPAHDCYLILKFRVLFQSHVAVVQWPQLPSSLQQNNGVRLWACIVEIFQLSILIQMEIKCANNMLLFSQLVLL